MKPFLYYEWGNRFMQLAELVASWSKDPSTRVGAVIVDDNKIVRGLGFNGFPRGVRDEPERYACREIKYKLIVHAEPNALLNANGNIRGCTLYCTKHPCSACAALVIQAGIRAVVCPDGGDERWAEDQTLARNMFAEADVDMCRWSNQ